MAKPPISRRFSLPGTSIALFAIAFLAFLPGAMTRWVLPKVALAAVAVALAAAARPSGRLPAWVAPTCGALGTVLLAAALDGAAPIPQLLGRWPRYEGLLALPAYAGALYAGARLLGPSADPRARLGVTRAFSWAAVALFVVALAEGAGLRPIAGDVARPGSLLGNATDQGAVGLLLVAFLAPTAISSFRSRATPDLVASAGAVAASAAVLLSGSRAALGALMLVAALHAIPVVRRARRRRRAALLSAAVVAAPALAALTLPGTRVRLLGLDSLAADSLADRIEMWRHTLALVGAHPLLGVGPSGFVDAVPAYFGPDWFASIGAGRTLDSPHTWPLQVLVAGGIPALLGVLVAGALFLRAAVLNIRVPAESHAVAPARTDLVRGAVVALAGYAFLLLTHFTIAGPAILAAFLAGIALARPAPAPPTAAAPGRTVAPPAGRGAYRARAPRPAVVGLAAWSAWLIVCAAAEVPLQSAVAAAGRGDVTAAERGFAVAGGLRPWDADIDLIAAEALAGAADRGFASAAPGAVEHAGEAVRRLPDSLRAAKALAVGLQYSGDYLGAIEALTRAGTLAPTDPEVFHRLGGLQGAVGDLAAAERSLLWAAELDPDRPGVQETLSAVHRAAELTGGPSAPGSAPATGG